MTASSDMPRLHDSSPAAIRRRQDAVIDALRALHTQHGYPPSLREVGDLIGRSAATVHTILRGLERAGRVRRVPGAVRAIEIVDDDQPEVLGVALPATTELRAQVGLIQRLAEHLLAGGRALRDADLHVAAAELEYAAQALIAGADNQVRVLNEQAAARRGADGR